MTSIVTFSKKAVGSTKITPNFKISEFCCKDGSDEIKLDLELVLILQAIRDHFGKPVNITSGYRSPSHNKAVGGSSSSYHLTGQAADIAVTGVDPLTVGLYAAELMGTNGGIEIGIDYCHIDTREGRWRAFTRSGGSSYTTVTDFGSMLKRNF